MRFDLSGDVIETVPNEKVLESIGEHLDSPPENPAEPKFASTVMLVRESAPGTTEYRIEDGNFPADFPTGQEMEVFMLRRVKSMAFVPDAVVYPGGRVDEADSNPGIKWAGPTPAEWAQLLCVPEEIARRVVVAAVREVFEEAGVMLAGEDENSVVSDMSDPSWEADRQASEAHEVAFSEILIKRGLTIRTDMLGLVCNWCTPTFEPRRYDTFFFAARMPEGQVAQSKTSESQIADWVTPAFAVREMDEGRWLVVPPTLYNLTRIAECPSVDEFTNQREPVTKFMFQPARNEAGEVVLRVEL